MPATLVEHPPEAHLGDLVERARGGDPEAFGLLYDRHHARVHRMLLGLTRSPSLAEDLTSETFFRAMRAIRTSRVRDDYVAPWLLRIARNLAVDHYKSRPSRHEVPVDPHDQGAISQDVAAGPDVEVLGSLRHAALLRAVRDLPVGQRTCITARFLEELSIAETARLMDCSEGAVKQLQHRALRSLAQRLRGV